MLALNVGKLERFTGSNYTRWKDQMIFLLTALKLSYLLDPNLESIPDPKPDDTDAVKKARSKLEEDSLVCRGYIVNSLSDRLYDLHRNMTSPREIWTALESTYQNEKKSTDKFLALKYFEFTMSDSKPILDQVYELQVMVSKMKELEINIPDSLQIGAILSKLPPSWNDYRKKILPSIDILTIESFRTHLQIESENRARDALHLSTCSGVNFVSDQSAATPPANTESTTSELGASVSHSTVFHGAPPINTFGARPSSTSGAPPSSTSVAPPSSTSGAPPSSTSGSLPSSTSGAPPSSTSGLLSWNNNQVNTEDMAEDPVQLSAPAAPVFGQPTVSPSPRFTFGGSTVPQPNPFSFGGSTVPQPKPFSFGGSTVPQPNPFSFGGSTVPQPSPFSFGGSTVPQPSPFSFGGSTVPQPSPFSFGGSTVPQPNPFSFGGSTVPQPSPFSFGGSTVPQPNPFLFGGSTPSPSPFQATSSLDFNAGGSFLLESSDKSGRRIVKASRNKNKK